MRRRDGGTALSWRVLLAGGVLLSRRIWSALRTCPLRSRAGIVSSLTTSQLLVSLSLGHGTWKRRNNGREIGRSRNRNCWRGSGCDALVREITVSSVCLLVSVVISVFVKVVMVVVFSLKVTVSVVVKVSVT